MKILNKINLVLTLMSFILELCLDSVVYKYWVANPSEYGKNYMYYWSLHPLLMGYINPMLILILTIALLIFCFKILVSKYNLYNHIICIVLSLVVIFLSIFDLSLGTDFYMDFSPVIPNISGVLIINIVIILRKLNFCKKK